MQKANVTMTACKDQQINWNAINWQEVNGQVNNLRKRIYRAACDGNIKTVRNLQKLMLRSRSNKLSAIRRVTQINQGRKTSGIDKIVINTDKDRSLLMKKLMNNDLKSVKPIKRVYIPKKGGKTRPLGLPTILDRCRQAVVKSALEPFWEAKFEPTSYGFRPGRSTHDAIRRIFLIANPSNTRKWVLDADIKGAFDNIDHDYLKRIIGNFPGRRWISAWLKSGVMEKCQVKPTIAGTPQGGIISPLLLNIALHGMEELLDISYYAGSEFTKQTSEYRLVRYADDMVIFAKSKESCMQAKDKLKPWLTKRGLEFSEDKTNIRHIEEGFNFLGFSIKHYKTKAKKNGLIMLCKPSKASIQSFKKQMITEWKKMVSWTTTRVIENLNPKIKGWCNYFRVGTSKDTFSSIDHWMWGRQARFVSRRHPKKYWDWKKKKYWGRIRGRYDQWVFMDKNHEKELYLWKLSWTPIKRHVMVKGSYSPDNPALKEYWQNRQAKNCKFLFKTRSILWRKQKGKCLICKDNIDNEEPIDIHHIVPRKVGGSDKIDNLAMLHTNCHRQVHSKVGQQTQAVFKLLEPYAE